MKVIGKYKVLELLGTGGSGVVYLAQHSETGKLVAIKSFSPPLDITDETAIKLRIRFENEIKLIKELDHNNIISFIDEIITENECHLVIEYVKAITKDPGELFTLETVLEVLTQTAKALDHAHRRGIVHRDIKPENILIGGTKEKPDCKLTDFGIATQTENSLNMTQTGEVLGTFFYMSPEQIESRECTPRTDIYALGLVGYELLTGKRVHDGVSPAKVISQIMASSPPPPSRFRSIIPSTLDRIILRCIRKDENARFQNASELLSELEALKVIGLDSAKTTQARLTTQFSPLVGRDKELSKLTRMLSDVRNGTPKYVYLVGPTGIGKTRLISELTSVSRTWGIRHISVQATKNDTSTPYGVIGKIAEQLIQIEEPTSKWAKLGLASISPSLAEITGEKQPELGAKELSHLIEDAFMWFTGNICKKIPLLVTIDDAQWADKASSKIARNIIKYFDDIGLFIVFAINTDMIIPHSETMKVVEETKTEVDLINLHPLDDSDIKQYLHFTLGTRETPENLLKFILKEAGGNPLYISELLRTVIKRGALKLDGDFLRVSSNELVVPGNILRYQDMSLSNLGTETGNLIKIAAVIGPNFSAEFIAEVSGKPLLEIHSHLDAALSNQLLRVSMTYRGNIYSFAHEQMRKNIETTASHHFRQNISQKTARAIEKLYSSNLSEHLENLIHHHLNSLSPTKAVPYLIRAGKFATDRYQHKEAISYTEKALSLSRENNMLEYIVSSLELLSDINRNIGDHGKGLTLITESLELSEELPQIASGHKARLYRKCASITISATGNRKKSLELAKKAVELLSGTVNLGEVSHAEHVFAGLLADPEAALVHAKRALQVSEQTNNKVMMIGCLGNIGNIQKRLGNHKKSMESFEKALEIGEKNGLDSILTAVYSSLAALMFNQTGDITKGRDYAEKAKILGRRTGNQTVIGFLNTVEATHLFQVGQMTQSEELFLSAGSIWEKTGQLPRLYHTTMFLGWLYHEIGNITKATDYLSKSKSILNKISPEKIDLDLVSLEVELLIKTNDLNKATILSKEILKELDKHPIQKVISIYYSIANLHVVNNNIIEAWKIIKKAKELAETHANLFLESSTLLSYAKILTSIIKKSESMNYLSKIMTMTGAGLLGKDVIKLTQNAFDNVFMSTLKSGHPAQVISYYLEHSKFLRIRSRHIPVDVEKLEKTISDELWKAQSLLGEIDHPRLSLELKKELSVSQDKGV